MSFPGRIKSGTELRSLALIVTAFVISRIAFHFAGIYFYHEFVKRMWQSIDIELLKTDMLQCLWYSHAQPPLFNLFTGLVVKVFPERYADVFHILIALVTLLTAMLLYTSLRKLRLAGWISLVISIYYLLCPVVVLYESMFSYTPFVVLLLTSAFFFLLRFLDTREQRDWLWFWIMLSALVLTRSSFHLLWLIAVLILLVIPYKKVILNARFMLIAIIPIGIVFLWYLKNLILFGAFTSSTWMGMNLSRIMPPLTPLGKIGSFKPLKDYHLSDTSILYPDVKLLHEQTKQNTGYENFYHIDYIAISDQFRKEVATTIRDHPGTYFERVCRAFVIYFSPSTHGPFLDKNYRHIKPYADLLNLDFSGYSKFKKEYFPTRFTLPVLLLYALILGLIIRGMIKQHFTQTDKVILMLILFNGIYSAGVSNTLEYGENNRFRYEIITVICLASGLAIRDLAPRTGKLTFKEKGT